MRVGSTAHGLGARIGGGAIAAALAFVVALLTGDGSPAAPTSSPGLSSFTTCAALRQWYVDHTIDQVGPYGWNGPMMFPQVATASGSVASPRAADDSVQNGPTGTNTQEPGVDEPDVAKTDGRIVVRLQGRRVVVTDVTGAAPRELAASTLPDGDYSGLLLVDGHVLVAGSAPFPRSYPADYLPTERSVLEDIDVSDPSSPRLVSHSTWSGTLLSLRQYGDTVRLVTSTGLPSLHFVQPGKGLGPAEATERNKEVVRASTIQQWLPSVQVDGGVSHPMDCASVYHSTAAAGRFAPRALGPRADDVDTLGVFTLHPGDPSPDSSVGVTGQGAQVYSSSDRLYVWDSVWSGPFRYATPDAMVIRPLAGPSTEVHEFALDGDDTRYVASGVIDGQVRDSWSFDEHDGLLRVAVSWTRRLPIERPRTSTDSGVASGPVAGPVTRFGTDNGIVVLGDQGGRLTPVGQVRGLGRGEELQAVRWFDDLAVLVTYEQADPVFTVDLADPDQPRLVGELRLPGFSSYLHPIGDDRLLGLGADGAVDGSQRAKAAVFDVTDLAQPRQLGTADVGPGTWFGASVDPHAFTWLPDGEGSGTAITSVVGADDRAHGIALVHVDRDGSVRLRTIPSAGAWPQRALPLPDGRVALSGGSVQIIAP